ncbi:S8 family peptidase [soil metagenome]
MIRYKFLLIIVFFIGAANVDAQKTKIKIKRDQTVAINPPVSATQQIQLLPLTENDWHLLDKKENGVAGISINKAYSLLKNKRSHQVIVAVIDSGIDTAHEDIKPVLWKNPGEIPGNGIDDDHNGYIDDVYGWNFLGGKDGRNVNEDSYEVARVYHKLKAKYGDSVPDSLSVPPSQRGELEMYRKAKIQIEEDGTSQIDLTLLNRIYNSLHTSDSLLQKAMDTATFTGNDLNNYNPATPELIKAKTAYITFIKGNNALDQTNKEFMEGFKEYLKQQNKKNEGRTVPPPEYRGEIVRDNENDINDRFYGNADVMAGTPFHGTHCAGIIGAAINNNKGVNGIANNVKIMMVRAVPDGDEHDKDIALAIRYAVDNGAQIISMSFGKDYSPQKPWVDDAVRYAESRNVLLVHAAGNDNKNVDSSDNFPNPVYQNIKGTASNFITVGASGDETNGGFTANFSNYGKSQVDVFAPGVKIYSTTPGSNYGFASGTSMAGPVVAGLAALLLEYYPDLSARQLKYVIENSTTAISELVKKPGTNGLVPFSQLSKSGGIVNAYGAVKLAAKLKGERKKLPVTKLSGKRD